MKRPALGTTLLLATLGMMFLEAGHVACEAGVFSEDPLPGHFYVATMLAIACSLVVGVGLLGLWSMAAAARATTIPRASGTIGGTRQTRLESRT